MKFIVDAQLPPSLADWLALKGHDAVHVATRACRRSRPGYQMAST